MTAPRGRATERHLVGRWAPDREYFLIGREPDDRYHCESYCVTLSLLHPDWEIRAGRPVSPSVWADRFAAGKRTLYVVNDAADFMALPDGAWTALVEASYARRFYDSVVGPEECLRDEAGYRTMSTGQVEDDSPVTYSRRPGPVGDPGPDESMTDRLVRALDGATELTDVVDGLAYRVDRGSSVLADEIVAGRGDWLILALARLRVAVDSLDAVRALVLCDQDAGSRFTVLRTALESTLVARWLTDHRAVDRVDRGHRLREYELAEQRNFEDSLAKRGEAPAQAGVRPRGQTEGSPPKRATTTRLVRDYLATGESRRAAEWLFRLTSGFSHGLDWPRERVDRASADAVVHVQTTVVKATTGLARRAIGCLEQLEEDGDGAASSP